MKAAAALLLLVASLSAWAQDSKRCVVDIRGNEVCGTRPGQCILDRYRAAWCAPANGTATTDRYGEVVCGAGACLRDLRGDIVCAVEPGGATVSDVANQISCAGGCQPASRSMCRLMTPN